MHLILRHKSPKTGKIEEKHLKTPPFVETDTKTHVYTAILRASNNRWACRVAAGRSALDGGFDRVGCLLVRCSAAGPACTFCLPCLPLAAAAAT